MRLGDGWMDGWMDRLLSRIEDIVHTTSSWLQTITEAGWLAGWLVQFLVDQLAMFPDPQTGHLKKLDWPRTGSITYWPTSLVKQASILAIIALFSSASFVFKERSGRGQRPSNIAVNEKGVGAFTPSLIWPTPVRHASSSYKCKPAIIDSLLLRKTSCGISFSSRCRSPKLGILRRTHAKCG